MYIFKPKKVVFKPFAVVAVKMYLRWLKTNDVNTLLGG